MPSHTHSEILKDLLGFAKRKEFIQDESMCDTGGDIETVNETVLMPEASNVKLTEFIKTPLKRQLQHDVPLKRTTSFHCEFCGKEFINSLKCRKHRYQVHKDAVYNCKLCKASFKTKSILNNHLKTHNEPMFSCDFCQMVKGNIAI